MPVQSVDVDGLLEAARRAAKEARRGDAIAGFEQALECDALTPPTRCSTLLDLGRVHLEAGRLEDALTRLEEAFNLADSLEEWETAANAINSIGLVHFVRGQLDEAYEALTEAGKRARAHGIGKVEAMTQQNLGTIASVRGEDRQALDLYQAALDRYQSLGLSEYVGPLLNNIGRTHTDLGEWEQASAVFEAATDACVAADDASHATLIQTNRTRLWIAKGDLEEAQRSCDLARMAASVHTDNRWLGQVMKHQGVIYRERGCLDDAQRELEAAVAVARKREDALLRAEAGYELAQVHQARGESRETLQSLVEAHRIFSDLRAQRVLLDIGRRMGRLEATFLEIVEKWGNSIDNKDAYTRGHCERVAGFGCLLAESDGFDPQLMIWFRMGCLLHDVGKVAVPDAILQKPGPLTDDEWVVMRKHPVVGHDLLTGIDFPWDVLPMIRGHHERWDGSGYPDGLAGEDIPRSARILCVADIFDGLTTSRPYRGAFPVAEAMSILEDLAGRGVDPHLHRLWEELVESLLTSDPAFAHVVGS